MRENRHCQRSDRRKVGNWCDTPPNTRDSQENLLNSDFSDGAAAGLAPAQTERLHRAINKLRTVVTEPKFPGSYFCTTQNRLPSGSARIR